MTVDDNFREKVMEALSGSHDTEYWLSRTPDERLIAMEMMRQIVYGYDAENPPRMQKVLEVRKCDWK
jgi:hypothetical protein